MENEKIQLNDQVVWNKQPPAMLVDEILDGGYALCTWREVVKGRAEVRREKFLLSQLTKYIPPEPFAFA